MTEKMLKFIKIDQENPNKRSVHKRVDDFKEVYDQFISNKAKEQSSRCSQCGVLFCQIHCPLKKNLRKKMNHYKYIAKIFNGDLLETEKGRPHQIRPHNYSLTQVIDNVK